MIDLKSKIRSIPDFPQKGVIFRDITTLLKDVEGLQQAIKQMHQKIIDLDYDVIVGAESRGFLFGMPIAYNEEKRRFHKYEAVSHQLSSYFRISSQNSYAPSQF